MPVPSAFWVLWDRNQSPRQPSEKLDCLMHVSPFSFLIREKPQAGPLFPIAVSCVSFLLQYYKVSGAATSCWALLCSWQPPGSWGMLFLHQCSESHEIETAALGSPLKSHSIDVYFILSLPRLKPQVGPFFPIVSSARLRGRWTWLIGNGFCYLVQCSYSWPWTCLEYYDLIDFWSSYKGFLECGLLLVFLWGNEIRGFLFWPSCGHPLDTKYSFTALPNTGTQYYYGGNIASLIIDAFQ